MKDKPRKKNTGSPAIDPDWMNWDEKNLDYEDESLLEKKRQLLERELARQLDEDGGRDQGSGASAAVASASRGPPTQLIPPSKKIKTGLF